MVAKLRRGTGLSAEPARAQECTDASRDATDYFLCGLRVRAAVPLPDLLPWTGDDRMPDVTICFWGCARPARPGVEGCRTRTGEMRRYMPTGDKRHRFLPCLRRTRRDRRLNDP
jgi:hypothetical protein